MSRLPELGTIKRIGAVLVALAIVLAAGTVVGQAPALFGADVTDDPEASIDFSDQTGDGTSVTVDNVSLSDGGFVVVTTDGQILGVSEYLGEGNHSNVTVEQHTDEDLEMLGQLTATPHQDATGNETFVGPDDVGDDEDHDRPYINDDGYPVSDTATVSMADRPEEGTTSTSFIVESAEATDRVVENGTLEIASEIRNPNDFEDRQHVDFRIDGEVRERQIISLSADESRQLNFSIDLGGVPPGEHSYGILTNEDGAIETFLVEYAPAAVTVTEASPETITANATLSIDGFLAVEDGNGSGAASPEALEYGDHENVTIDVAGEFEDNETATVVVYGGDPDETGAMPYVDEDGERVQSAAVIQVEDPPNDQLVPGEGNVTDDNETDGTGFENETDGNETGGVGNETDADETGDAGNETDDADDT